MLFSLSHYISLSFIPCYARCNFFVLTHVHAYVFYTMIVCTLSLYNIAHKTSWHRMVYLLYLLEKIYHHFWKHLLLEQWHRNRITTVVKVENNYIDSIAASLKGKSCVTSDHVCRNLLADVVGFICIVIMCSMWHWSITVSNQIVIIDRFEGSWRAYQK